MLAAHSFFEGPAHIFNKVILFACVHRCADTFSLSCHETKFLSPDFFFVLSLYFLLSYSASSILNHPFSRNITVKGNRRHATAAPLLGFSISISCMQLYSQSVLCHLFFPGAGFLDFAVTSLRVTLITLTEEAICGVMTKARPV